MPEGDTIHKAAAKLRPALEGATLVRFEAARASGAVPRPGTTITAVEAQGKYLLVRFADGHVLQTHMKMTGRWDLYRTGERWWKPAHLARAVIEVEGFVAVCFSAPVVRIIRVTPDDRVGATGGRRSGPGATPAAGHAEPAPSGAPATPDPSVAARPPSGWGWIDATSPDAAALAATTATDASDPITATTGATGATASAGATTASDATGVTDPTAATTAPDATGVTDPTAATTAPDATTDVIDRTGAATAATTATDATNVTGAVDGAGRIDPSEVVVRPGDEVRPTSASPVPAGRARPRPGDGLHNHRDQRYASLDHLGPDLCRADVDLDLAVRRMVTIASPDDDIADVLLDQRVAAGIGNVYKSEVLWACRLHPLTPLGQVDEPLRRLLLETAAAQLQANLTTRRRTTVAGPPGSLAVYHRSRRPCRRCGTPIRWMRTGRDHRSTYWCPRCQPASVTS